MRLTCCLANQIRPCDGPIQLHHLVSQSAIRRRHRSLKAAHRRGGPKAWSITAALKDPANLVPVCWSHHQLVEGHRLYPDPPQGFQTFLSKYDLYAVLPRHLSSNLPDQVVSTRTGERFEIRVVSGKVWEA